MFPATATGPSRPERKGRKGQCPPIASAKGCRLGTPTRVLPVGRGPHPLAPFWVLAGFSAIAV